MVIHKRTAVLALLVGIMGLGGCGGDKRPPTFAVCGKVTYKKSTIPVGAMVVFHPIDPAVEKRIGGKPRARVREDGTYQLTMFGPDDGAPEGEYGVTIDWRSEPKAKALFGDSEGRTSKPLLHPRYGNPAQPFARVTVKKGEKNEFHFEVD